MSELKEIGTRIYYLKKDDTVLFYDNDRKSVAEPPSVEEDFNTLSPLIGKSKDDVGVIQLEYGEIEKQYKNKKANAWKIEGGSIIYYFDEKIEAPPIREKTLDEIMDEKINEVKTELSTAITEIIENTEATKTELSTAIAEVVEMLNENAEG